MKPATVYYTAVFIVFGCGLLQDNPVAILVDWCSIYVFVLFQPCDCSRNGRFADFTYCADFIKRNIRIGFNCWVNSIDGLFCADTCYLNCIIICILIWIIILRMHYLILLSINVVWILICFTSRQIIICDWELELNAVWDFNLLVRIV